MFSLKKKDIQAALRGLEFTVDLEIVKRKPNVLNRPVMPANKRIMIGGRSTWRDVLPYGRWLCADGTQVLFDRRYCGLWQRSPAGVTIPAKNLWLENVEAEFWFFNDDCTPWHNNFIPGFDALTRCVRALFDFGITIEPSKTRAIKEAMLQAPTITKTIWYFERRDS
jgi:hypothetical protein